MDNGVRVTELNEPEFPVALGVIYRRPATSFEQGFYANHPTGMKRTATVDDIMRKSFLGVRNLSDNAPLGSGFQQTVESSFRSAEPFMRFLCKSVGVPY